MKGNRSTIGIKDVAQRAGVSTATAGRVLGGYGYSSPDTKERVLQSAIELGYRPNLLARGLITGTTKTIGVVAGDIQSPFHSAIIRGITDVAKAEGFGVLVTNTDERLENEIEAVELLLEKQVDGLIIAPSDIRRTEHLEAIVAQGHLLVQIDRRSPTLQTDSVTVDNRDAAYQATRQLLQLGHKRIGAVVELVHWNRRQTKELLERMKREPAEVLTLPPSLQRLVGHIDAIEDAKLNFDPQLIIRTGENTAESAYHATLEALSRANRPTALFTVDGRMSEGTMRTINALRLSIPDDISILCFDDLEWMTFLSPGVSAIRQPLVTIGNSAVRLLVEKLEGVEREPCHLQHKAEFIRRGSLGPPALIAA